MTAADESDLIAEARRLEAEGRSQRQIADALGKPRHWVRYSLGASAAKDNSTATIIDVPALLSG
jgi:hypothetical protein